MKIAAISDVHVKFPQDEADLLLQSFFEHPSVKEADYIVLLGDIFDLMCGPHKAYLEKFSHLFNLMDEAHKRGSKIYFFEGNHDVHLEKLFRKRWPLNEVVLSQEPIVEIINGKTYYFSHGDEHEVDNEKYQKYKSFILSEPLKFIANHVMPYRVLNFIGERASEMSRKRGSKTYNEDHVRERFRKGVTTTTAGQYHFILGGHSHVQDIFELGPTSIYANNGYALKSKTFLLVEDHKISFPLLKLG